MADEPLQADYDRGLLLLAWLSIRSGEPQRREALAELLWPDEPEGVGRRRLREVLYRLRRGLREDERAEPLLVVERDSIALHPEGDWSSDLQAFDGALRGVSEHDHRALQACPACLGRLELACGVYRGDLLAEERVPSEGLGERVMRERSLRREAVLAALGALGDQALARQAWAEARSWAERAAAIDPDDERGLRVRMSALNGEGRRPEALRSYEALVERREGAGQPAPEDETEELYQALLHGEEIRPAPGPRVGFVPAPVSPLIGRAVEVERAEELLSRASVRMVTVTGLGGVGKTRLALEVASRLERAFADGVWFVAAQETSTAAELALAVLATLRVRPGGVGSELDSLIDWVRPRQILLVLDNLEQNAGAALVIDALLRASPGLRVLATSRVLLGLRAEHLLVLGGLASGPAVELWLQRARQLRPDLVADMGAISEICEVLGGLPLAIEFTAAAREACATVRASLGDGLRLVGPFVDLPAHQRSMRLILEASVGRLDPQDARHLGLLAVFRGAFLPEDAWAVCGVPGAGLERLLHHSLVGPAPGGRHQLHPIVAAFAREIAVDRSAAQVAHRRWFLDPARASTPADWAQELPDVRAAWQSALEAEDLALLAERAYALQELADRRGWMIEGLRWFEDAAERLRARHLASAAARRCLACAGALAYNVGRRAQSEAWLREAASLARAADDGDDLGFALKELGFVLRNVGRPAEALPLLEEAMGVFAARGDALAETGARCDRGAARYEAGDLPGATQDLEQVVRAFLDHDLPLRAAGASYRLALCEVLRGDERAGIQRLLEALRTQRRHGAHTVSDTLGGLAIVCLMAGRYPEARRYAREAAQGYRRTHFFSGVAAMLLWESVATIAMGRPAEARASLLEGLDLALGLEGAAPLLRSAVALAWFVVGSDAGFAAQLIATVDHRDLPAGELRRILDPLRGRVASAAPLASPALSPEQLRGAVLGWRAKVI